MSLVLIFYVFFNNDKIGKFLFSQPRKNEGWTLVCPKCGSTEVVNDLTRDMIVWNGSTRYLCKICDYSAPFFPEVLAEDVKEYEKSIGVRAKTEKETLEKYNVSKGFTNRTVNMIYLLIQFVPILIISIGIILFGLQNVEFITIYLYLTLILAILIVGYFISRAK